MFKMIGLVCILLICGAASSAAANQHSACFSEAAARRRLAADCQAEVHGASFARKAAASVPPRCSRDARLRIRLPTLESSSSKGFSARGRNAFLAQFRLAAARGVENARLRNARLAIPAPFV